MKSPGIVLKKDISMYQTEILSQMQLFFEFYRDRIIGITGTKGKSTTTTLLHHILKESGRPAILAGNIGIPVFDILHEITDESFFVIELSCHQLEYMTISPKWGILLNIYEEHLDHYGTLDKYIASKEKIYEKAAQELGGNVLIIFDRGTVDNFAYINQTQTKELLKRFNNKINLVNLLERYDLVIDLVSREDFYTTENNQARSENVREALDLGITTLNINNTTKSSLYFIKISITSNAPVP